MSDIPIIPIDFPSPTLEEHNAASAKWLQDIHQHLFEHWPNVLKSLSFKTMSVRLSKQDQLDLRALYDSEYKPIALERKLDCTIGMFDRVKGTNIRKNGFFARLSSRSGKDVPDQMKRFNGKQVIEQFLQSERILDDLVQYRYARHACRILIREWHDIPPHQEWRVFIRHQKIVGITQYHYRTPIRFPEDYANADVIANGLVKFINQEVIPVLHIQTVVVDVWLKDNPLLIEINPYGLSDPCLLTYDEMAENRTGFSVVINLAETDFRSGAMSKIKAGDLVILSEYATDAFDPMFVLCGVCATKVDFDTDTIKAEYLALHPNEAADGEFNINQFLAFLWSKDLFVRCTAHEWKLTDRQSISEMDVTRVYETGHHPDDTDEGINDFFDGLNAAPIALPKPTEPEGE